MAVHIPAKNAETGSHTALIFSQAPTSGADTALSVSPSVVSPVIAPHMDVKKPLTAPHTPSMTAHAAVNGAAIPSRIWPSFSSWWSFDQRLVKNTATGSQTVLMASQAPVKNPVIFSQTPEIKSDTKFHTVCQSVPNQEQIVSATSLKVSQTNSHACWKIPPIDCTAPRKSPWNICVMASMAP